MRPIATRHNEHHWTSICFWCFSPCVRVSCGCFQRTIGRLIKLSNHITPSPAITIRCGAEVDYAQALPKPSAAGWHRPWYPCKAGTCCPKEHKRGVLCSWEESVQSACWCFSPCVRVSCGCFQRTIGRLIKLSNHITPSPAITIRCGAEVDYAQALPKPSAAGWHRPWYPCKAGDVLSERT